MSPCYAPEVNKFRCTFLSKIKSTPVVFICLLAAIHSSTGSAGEAIENHLAIAVATNFVSTLKPIAQEFEDLTNTNIRISSGSTGKLYTQIVNGMQVDVFLSGDQDRAIRLVNDGMAIESSHMTYALGKLAYWTPNTTRKDGRGKNIKPVSEVDVLAVAEPKLAPYGLAAAQSIAKCFTLENSTTLVYGENIGQTYAFTATGNADAGFVALASLLTREGANELDYVVVGPECHDPIRQDAVLLKDSMHLDQGRRFLDFLRSVQVRELITQSGYTVP